MINLSILIPVYNGENYIKGCLGSIKHNPSIKIEIITVDDGSTDQSLMILKKYVLNEKRLHVYENNDNRGVGYARNFLLGKAKGNIFILLILMMKLYLIMLSLPMKRLSNINWISL